VNGFSTAIRRLFGQVSSFLGAVLDWQIIRNATTLYGSHFANMFLPLITIPFLARVLGPETWGTVIFVQAVGMYINLAIDYGFEASATRDVARDPANVERHAEIAAGVLGARIMLALGCLIVIAPFALFVPLFQDAGLLVWVGFIWFLAMGFRPLWYFLGVERVGKYLAVEVGIKSAGVAAVFLLVRGPGDALLVFILQGGAMALATSYGMIYMYRCIPFKAPSFATSWLWLRRGWHMFIFYVSTSVYNMGNTIILGFVSAPINVSYYGGAERISRALVSIIFPLVQAVYPRSSHLIVEDRQAAARLARLTMGVIAMSALAGGVVLWILSPYLIQIVLGQGYDEAVSVLRVLLLILPLIGVSAPLINHWFMPLGLESLATRITLSAGAIHVPLAIYLGYNFAHVGIAWAMVVTELLITTTLITISLVRGIGPFRFADSEVVAPRSTQPLQIEKR
jgi:polysaccharide transporter, PST family